MGMIEGMQTQCDSTSRKDHVMTFKLPPTDRPVWADHPTLPFQLVLEGGGLRGMFTAGVLDFFMDHGLLAQSVVGVSMGAICGYSYVAGEPGYTAKMALAYRDDPRFMSLQSWLRTGTFVGNRFIFSTIPNEIAHVSQSWFSDSPMTLTSVATNVDTGEADYQVIRGVGSEADREREMRYLEGSSALPYVSRMVEVDGKRLLDGGMVDSIPFAHGLPEYRGREVVILTRERGFVRPNKPVSQAMAMRYAAYPNFLHDLQNRSAMYNDELREVERLHDSGDLFAIWPATPIVAKVYEKSKDKMLAAYEQGLAAAANQWDDLLAFLRAGGALG